MVPLRLHAAGARGRPRANVAGDEANVRKVQLLQRFIAILAVLAGSQFALAEVLERGPYLQIGTPESIIVKWRTDVSTDSVVKFGPNPASLTMTAQDATSTTEHEVLVSGLAADTTYFYSIGSAAVTLAGGDSEHYFVTSPPTGNAKPTRLWIVGDSGTADASARAVRDAYLAFLGAEKTDLLLMLGDNAYNVGTDAEYQAAVFDMYPQILRNTVVWPTLGNHDAGTQPPPYYNIFTLPTAAEAGGLASGTEAYYSFDYGNVHFVCLDSQESSRSPGGAMMTWLNNDLNANTQPWVIAFWHHPPYSKGSHNSDTEGRLVDMRTNANPILEAHGVDLILGGHSHAYERSFLIDQHYGLSGTFSCNPALGNGNACGSGQEENNGLYQKPDLAGSANQGAVYTVAGSSGKISGGTFDHPAMFLSISVLGSVVLDINDDRLDATFLDSTGNILDHYTVHKGADTTAPQLTSAEAPDSLSVEVVYSEPVDQTSAETAANYTLDGGATVSSAVLGIERRSVVLTTSALSPGVTYLLTVNGVTDNTGNTIAPNSQQQFVVPNLVEECFQDAVCPDAGYAGTSDAYLSEAAPSANAGAALDLLVDGSDPSPFDKATVIRWDTSSIPVGSTVESAQITFNITNPTPNLYELYQLIRPWDESVVSWNAATAGDNWDTAGAQDATDRNPTVLGELSIGTTGIYTLPLNTDGVAAVQSWVDSPAANQGIIIANSTSGDGVDFDSREVGIAANRPKLTVTYTPSGVAPPDAPTGLSLVSNTDTEVEMSWAAPAAGMPVTDYNVYRDGVNIDTTAGTTYTDTGLDPDTGYAYEVKSVGPGGESVVSNALNVTTDPTAAPDPPTSLSLDSKTETEVGMSWTAPAGGTPVTDYNVYRDGVNIDTTAGTTYTDTGLDPDTAYGYEVKAAGPGGESVASNTLNVTTDPTAAPDPPTGLSLVSKTETEVAMSWTAPAGGTPVTDYNIYRGGVSIDTTAGTAYTDTGLNPDTAYSYQVKSVGLGGESIASNTLNVTTDSAPTPDTVRVDSITMQLGNRKKFRRGVATVTVLDNNGSPVAGATVNGLYMIPAVSPVSGTTNGSGQTVLESPEVLKSQSVEFHLSITSVTGLTPPFVYDEAGSVTSACIASDGSSCGAPPPPDTDPPAAPTGLTANGGMLTVALDWNDNGEADLAEYHIFRSTSSPVCPGGVCPAPLAQIGTTSSYNDNSVTADVTYYYVVTALDGSGNESSISNPASATPTAPSGATLHIQAIGIVVNPENGKRYRGTATVTVASSDSSAFTNATVVGTWDIPNSGPVSASSSTGTNGIATITSPKVKANTGQLFTFTVTDIQHGTMPYSPGNNVVGSGAGATP